MPPLIPAILNTRVSTDKQDMDRQDFLLGEYCQRHDLQPVATYPMPAVSGYSVPMLERPGAIEMFHQLAQLASEGPVAFVTTDQDRVGRDLLDIVGTVRRLWEMGVVPHFAAEGGAFTRSPENEMALGIKAAAAQYLCDKIKSNIRMKFAAKRARGEALNGQAPYGWNLVAAGGETKSGKPLYQLQPNEEEQLWILKMFQLQRAGHGYRAIATWLNNQDVPTKRGIVQIKLRGQLMQTCGKWKFGGVAKVLNNQTTRAWLAEQGLPQAA